jgi:hypothetical protein
MSLVDAATVPSNDNDDSGRRTIEYSLDDEEIEHAKALGADRHQSYADGRTSDEDWGDSRAVMERGVVAELVATMCYEEFSFDTYVGADGDDGSDGCLRLEPEGEPLDVDVKSRQHDDESVRFGVELMVAQHHVESRDTPDVYLAAYVSDDLSECRLEGYVTTETLREADLIESRVDGEDHQNYTVLFDELESMPVHHNAGEYDNAEVVWI